MKNIYLHFKFIISQLTVLNESIWSFWEKLKGVAIKVACELLSLWKSLQGVMKLLRGFFYFILEKSSDKTVLSL